jgi:N-sulfoglucosamine sulfohydrolase
MLLRGLAAVFALIIAQHSGAAEQERPNILLLMAEDMSSRVGAFGDSVAVTPNLDALAEESVRYTNTFTTAGVCAPSRAAQILGMHQISTGTQHMRSSTRPEGGYVSVPPEGVKAYPELLRGAGYYTYTDHKLDYQFSSPFPNSGPPTVWDSEGEAAPTWRGREKGQPFFGMRAFAVTHESGIFPPLGSMPEGVVHFAMQVIRWWRLDEAVANVVDPADVEVPPYYPDTETVRGDLARHYNNIAYMDAEVGAILQQLEEDGLADSTIVIWTTDHGDGLPRAKRELFDSGLKVPMIIRWPDAYRPEGVAPGTVDARLISFVDLAPTILSLAGVDTPDYIHGINFSEPNTTPREYVYASRDRVDEIMDRQRALRDERFKYIRSWYPDQPEATGVVFRQNIDMVREMHAMYEAGELNANQRLWFEAPGEERLFDLQNDPYEIYNLADKAEYAGELTRMRAALNDWLSRVKDWSEQPEGEMVARFQPGEEQLVTPVPSVIIQNGQLIIEPAASGHSLEYRIGGGRWRLYTKPVPVSTGSKIEARAVRYGWKESDIVAAK